MWEWRVLDDEDEGEIDNIEVGEEDIHVYEDGVDVGE